MLGDAYGAAVVAALSRKEIEVMNKEQRMSCDLAVKLENKVNLLILQEALI